MFKFFKEKVKRALNKFSEKVEEEGEIVEENKEGVVEEKKGFLTKIKDKFKKKEEKIVEKAVEEAEEKEVEPTPEIVEKESTDKKILLKEELEEAEKLTEEIIKEAKPEKEKKEVEEKIEEKIKEVVKKRELEEVQEKELVKEEKVEKIKKEPMFSKTSIVETEEPTEGFFTRLKQKITTIKIDENKFDNLFWDLEVAMLENNVAVEVINKIKEDLRKELVNKLLPRGKTEELLLNTLKESIKSLFKENNINIVEKAKQKKPLIICFVGVNGSGKTTTIAKIAKMLKDNNLSVVIAAADTFRAAAIDQLQIHADKLSVKLIKHDYGSDAAAVAFDAVKHAKARNKDVVLIDTAGRLHSNHDLIEEMKKIVRVVNPDLKIFVGESITGNDCIEQAQKFNEAINLDGIILSKADIDEKGGTALSVSYITGKPILYLGTGQEYSDLEKFSKEKIIENLGL